MGLSENFVTANIKKEVEGYKKELAYEVEKYQAYKENDDISDEYYRIGRVIIRLKGIIKGLEIALIHIKKEYKKH